MSLFSIYKEQESHGFEAKKVWVEYDDNAMSNKKKRVLSASNTSVTLTLNHNSKNVEISFIGKFELI